MSDTELWKWADPVLVSRLVEAIVIFPSVVMIEHWNRVEAEVKCINSIRA